jgi:hypothetical protein
MRRRQREVDCPRDPIGISVEEAHYKAQHPRPPETPPPPPPPPPPEPIPPQPEQQPNPFTARRRLGVDRRLIAAQKTRRYQAEGQA